VVEARVGFRGKEFEDIRRRRVDGDEDDLLIHVGRLVVVDRWLVK